MAYVLYGFRPDKGQNMNGLFQFTIQNKSMSPDTFHVRITSNSGVSIHSGHVPSPETFLVDCRITLSHEVMEEMLNGKSDPSSLLLSGRINVEGQLQKLLLFRDVFKFALSRFNVFIDGWNKWVALEEKELADRARGKILEPDLEDALQYLCYSWKGVVPKSWGKQGSKTGFILISQLPDNIYYKGYSIKQKYLPPKICLKINEDSFEYFGMESSNTAFDGQVMCELYGKKSVLVDLFCGNVSLMQVLNFLDSDEAPNYYYAHSKKGENFDPSLYKTDSQASFDQEPPLLFVRNFSHFDGVNDFEEMMRCFDINRLSYDRYCGERRQSEISDSHVKKETNNIAKLSTSQRPQSPVEWVEKLKEAKLDIQKRIRASSFKAGSSSKGQNNEEMHVIHSKTDYEI